MINGLFKWPGGKKKALDYIRAELRPSIGRTLVEACVGGGSIFLNLWRGYGSVVIADINDDLINAYSCLGANWNTQMDAFVDWYFRPENNNPDFYYAVRDAMNARQPAYNLRIQQERAAMLLYLNRHCFNGLMRQNQSGEYNMPFGDYKSVSIPLASIKALRALAFVMGDDFVMLPQDVCKTIDDAPTGSDIIVDPPYSELPGVASFTSYHAEGFGSQKWTELIQSVLGASERNCKALVFNHDTEETRELFSDADRIIEIGMARSINSDGAGRDKITELMAIYEPKE